MILTIDVGLKNLAMCIMSANDPEILASYKIHLWQVFNTLEQDIPNCCALTKAGKVCGKKSTCRWQKEDSEDTSYSCKPHFPKTITLTAKNQVRSKRVDDFLLQDITRIILQKVQSIYQEHLPIFTQVQKVVIELQPKVNNKMKLISHLIYGKFVELYLDSTVPIRFVSASQKLKAYRGPVIPCSLKGSYARRKYLSIQYTKWFLTNQFDMTESVKWQTHFDSHSKQDDLGDVFLMAINCLGTKSTTGQAKPRTTNLTKVRKTKAK
ncbi:MAG: hypothetical protein EBU90_14225 [Proteobacteria bacterium]|nr:hypothetical protein [Pseudomonadota bacterium]NBP14260.1 hypothetical protein [bacterium]